MTKTVLNKAVKGLILNLEGFIFSEINYLAKLIMTFSALWGRSVLRQLMSYNKRKILIYN